MNSVQAEELTTAISFNKSYKILQGSQPIKAIAMNPVSMISLAMKALPHVLDKSTAMRVAADLLGRAFDDFGRLRAIYDNAGIDYCQIGATSRVAS